MLCKFYEWQRRLAVWLSTCNFDLLGAAGGARGGWRGGETTKRAEAWSTISGGSAPITKVKRLYCSYLTWTTEFEIRIDGLSLFPGGRENKRKREQLHTRNLAVHPGIRTQDLLAPCRRWKIMKYFPRNTLLKCWSIVFRCQCFTYGTSFSEKSLLLLPTYYLYTNACTFYFVHLKNTLVSFVFKNI